MKTLVLFCIFFYLNHLIEAETEEEALSQFIVKDGFILWARSTFRLKGASPGYCAMKCLSLGDRCQSFDYNIRHQSCFGRSQGSDIFSNSRHHQRFSLRHQKGYKLFVKATLDDVRELEEENPTEVEVDSTIIEVVINEATQESKINKQTTTEATTTTRRTRRPKITTQATTEAIPTDRPTTTEPTTTKSSTTRKTRRPKIPKTSKPTTTETTTRTEPTTTESTTIKSTTRSRPTTTESTTEPTTTESTTRRRTRRPKRPKTSKPTTTESTTRTQPTTTKSTTTEPTTTRSTTTEPTTTKSTTTEPTTTKSTTTEPTTTKSTTTESTTKLTTTTTRKTRRPKTPKTPKPTTTETTTILPNINRNGDCFEPLGMESGEILDSDISASTTYFLNYASNARLNNDKFWMPSANDNQQFLQVNFKNTTLITRIGIQGVQTWYTSGYITSYKVEYQPDQNSQFQLYEDSFGVSEIEGSLNVSDEALYEFKPSFRAISIKIIPISWYKNIGLRMELYTSAFC